MNEVDVTLARYGVSPAAFRVTRAGSGVGCLLVFLPQAVVDGPVLMGPSTR